MLLTNEDIKKAQNENRECSEDLRNHIEGIDTGGHRELHKRSCIESGIVICTCAYNGDSRGTQGEIL